MKWQGKFFKEQEFACKCGHAGCTMATPAAVRAAIRPPPGKELSILHVCDILRKAAGVPLTIVSGLRCLLHKIARGKILKYGAGYIGAHGGAFAADVLLPKDRLARMRLITAILALYADGTITGVGISRTFIHVDVWHPMKKMQKGRTIGALWHYCRARLGDFAPPHEYGTPQGDLTLIFRMFALVQTARKAAAKTRRKLKR